jgi:hypothetical protein
VGPDNSITISVYLKDEGFVLITVDNIVYEITLEYPTDPDSTAVDPDPLAGPPADNPMIQE